MLHHLLQQSGADLGFHTPSPANSARRLGSALLSEKNGDVDHKTVLHLKEKKISCRKSQCDVRSKAETDLKKKYFEGDFFIVYCVMLLLYLCSEVAGYNV